MVPFQTKSGLPRGSVKISLSGSKRFSRFLVYILLSFEEICKLFLINQRDKLKPEHP